ncbi:MAG TPA: hypothetical protein DCZ72_01635 [Armatimonadetes bacterium]|nr:hypothetical protein [Armatimonadota bacterium]
MGKIARVLRSLLALGLALGAVACGSGGSAVSPVAPQGGRTIAAVRGVPETITVYNSRPVRLAGGGDDYLLILSEPNGAEGLARVQLNGGTTELPRLEPLALRARDGGHVPFVAGYGLLGELAGGAPVSRQAALPAAGSERRFRTSQDLSGGVTVTATLREKGRHCLVYVDQATEAGALTAANLAELRAAFDERIYATDTGALGQPSDIDHNERVIILLTPAMAPRNLGYFTGYDLLPGYGNDAEMLYVAVPRPSEGRTYEQMRVGLQATIAHEMSHLISFYHKRQLLGEEHWLEEALAFLVEQLNGYVDMPAGVPGYVEYYLSAPERYTGRMLGGGYERGHAGLGFLFVRYLADQFGVDVLQRLVRARAKGHANIRQATGQPYAALQPPFAAALYLTGTGLSADPRYTLKGFDTRGTSPGAGVTLRGPGQTTLSAASGRPAAAISWAAGGLRYVRLTEVPADGAQFHLTTAATTVQATFVRIPADAP